jgi:hypothetical protein
MIRTGIVAGHGRFELKVELTAAIEIFGYRTSQLPLQR